MPRILMLSALRTTGSRLRQLGMHPLFLEAAEPLGRIPLRAPARAGEWLPAYRLRAHAGLPEAGGPLAAQNAGAI